MAQGKFIVIDGTDGSGKTVQANRLIERLRAEGRNSQLQDFPRYGKPSAWFVEKYLKGDYGSAAEVGPKRASMFFALDRYDAAPQIREALAQGSVLVSNRYVSANKGHQTGKIEDPQAQIEFLDWLNDLEYGLMGIPKPDLTLLLHVPADIGFELSRSRDGERTDIHQKDIEHLRAAERAYLRLPEIDTAENWKVVECVEDGKLLPIDAIHERVWSLVSPLL
ncbi:MAG: thymidylate kinase [Patescibacteria group bacterium]